MTNDTLKKKKKNTQNNKQLQTNWNYHMTYVEVDGTALQLAKFKLETQR